MRHPWGPIWDHFSRFSMLRPTTSPSVLRALALGLSAALTFVAACPTPDGESTGEGEGEGEGEGGEGEGEGEDPSTGDCPDLGAGVTSVCDVQDPASPNHVAEGGNVVLTNVVATTDAFGSSFEDGAPTRYNLYVANTPNAIRGGVYVRWFADAGLVTDIVEGDVLTIEGTVAEFNLAGGSGSETQIEPSLITKLGGNTPVAPLPVTAADLTGGAGENYEGVLVTLEGGGTVATTENFAFVLDNGVRVATNILQYPALVGEEIASITGVVRFDGFGGLGFELSPRKASDVVSTSRPTKTVTEVNALTPCASDNSELFQCIVEMEGIVTSPPVFINDNDAVRGALFGFYVADAANVDAGGRFGPNSGIFVTVTPGSTAEVTLAGGYAYTADGRNWADGPRVGDLVSVSGDHAERFGLPALRFTSRVTKTGTGTVPLPALFNEGGTNGAHPVSDLKGGRPDFAAGDFPGLENVAASPNVGQWEAVLVELQNVETTNACYAQPFAPSGGGAAFARDFGNFLVTGDVEIGDAFRLSQSFGGFFRADAPNAIPDTAKTCANVANKCQDSRVAGQEFTSLIGIVDYNFNVNRVNPRTAADITGVTLVAAGTPAANCPSN
ncbi:MAG TPA: hypothetical protein VGF99_08720, partial [Myxococcota bacterium]